MSSSVNSHWHETSDEQPVRVRAKHESSNTHKTVSRYPAAVLGVLIVLGIIFYQFGDGFSLLGQIANTSDVPEDIEVSIESGAFSPEAIVVQQGQRILWFNEEETPHSLESDNLCNADNACFVTPTILQGESAFFVIPPDIEIGTYTYTSSANPLLVGRIVVQPNEDNVLTLDEEPAEPLEEFRAAAQPEEETFGSSEFSLEDTNKGPSNKATSNPSAGIPTNPYTVGSAHIHPYDETGNAKTDSEIKEETQLRPAAPAVPAPTPSTKSTVQEDPPLLTTEQKPHSQPETGFNSWLPILIASSLLGFMLVQLFGGVRIVIRSQ